MSDDSYDVKARMRRSQEEDRLRAEREAAAERAKWARCATPQPLTLEPRTRSVRIIQPGSLRK